MLHVERRGSGPDLVLVHGWGMHGGLWRAFVGHLSVLFRVSVVDLPGHGNSDWDGDDSLDGWARRVLEVAPREAFWIGWSLGGLVALEAARQAPERLRGLMLMASTPRFVTAPDWPCAVDGEVFAQFAAQLDADLDKTLGRFLALQVRGATNGGELLRRLRADLKTRPAAHPQALRAGLALLQETDLRARLRQEVTPLCGVFGERDTLAPASVVQLLPPDRGVVLEGAGHAPFLSHPEACCGLAGRWFLDGQVAR